MSNLALKQQKKPSLDLWDNKTVKWEHDGKRYCLHVRNDDMADSLREDDCGTITIMACFHRRYNLGDYKQIGKMEPEEFWQKLVKENVKESEILAAGENGKIKGVRIAQNEDAPERYDIFEVAAIFGEQPKEYLEHEDVSREDIVYYLLDDLNIGQCMVLLEPYAEWLPLWLYDHSGLTISCGARVYPYNDVWDSGQVGWIVALKDTIMKETTELLYDENGEPIKEEHNWPSGQVTYGYKCRPLTDETWRKRAVEVMKADVEVYDQYLRGEVYGYNLYEAKSPESDAEDPEWEEIDSCWGFYGTDIIENGIAGQAGCGLAEAVAAGEYEVGEAVKHTATYYEF